MSAFNPFQQQFNRGSLRQRDGLYQQGQAPQQALASGTPQSQPLGRPTSGFPMQALAAQQQSQFTAPPTSAPQGAGQMQQASPMGQGQIANTQEAPYGYVQTTNGPVPRTAQQAQQDALMQQQNQWQQQQAAANQVAVAATPFWLQSNGQGTNTGIVSSEQWNQMNTSPEAEAERQRQIAAAAQNEKMKQAEQFVQTMQLQTNALNRYR